MAKILALDPSTKAVGYALLCTDTDRILDYGVYKVEGNDLDMKMRDASFWLNNRLCVQPATEWPDVLAVELPVYHRNVKTLRTLAQMVGALRVAGGIYTDRVIEILPSERRLALGIPLRLKATPAKDAIRHLVNQIYDLDLGPKEHDISDAVAIALAAAKKLKLEEERT